MSTYRSKVRFGNQEAVLGAEVVLAAARHDGSPGVCLHSGEVTAQTSSGRLFIRDNRTGEVDDGPEPRWTFVEVRDERDLTDEARFPLGSWTWRPSAPAVLPDLWPLLREAGVEIAHDHGSIVLRRGEDQATAPGWPSVHCLELVVEWGRRLVPGEWRIELDPGEARALMRTLSGETQAALRAARPDIPGWLMTASGVDVVSPPGPARTTVERHGEVPVINPASPEAAAAAMDAFITGNSFGGPRQRPYTGQSWTFWGERGKQALPPMTLRDLGDHLVERLRGVEGLERVDLDALAQRVLLGLESKPWEVTRREA